MEASRSQHACDSHYVYIASRSIFPSFSSPASDPLVFSLLIEIILSASIRTNPSFD